MERVSEKMLIFETVGGEKSTTYGKLTKQAHNAVCLCLEKTF